MGTDVWSHAVAIYARPGVAEACVHLQDAFGADVPLLLFALWAGAVCGRTLDPEAVAELATMSAAWQTDVVVPLRSVRRRLRTLETDDAAEAGLRAMVKTAELAAERLQLDRLAACAGLTPPARPQGTAANALANLTAVLPERARGTVALDPLRAAVGG